MKKLKLKALQIGADEILTRAQLKAILGGDGGSGGSDGSDGSGTGVKKCTTDSDCGTKTVTNACGQSVSVSGVCTTKGTCVWGTAC